MEKLKQLFSAGKPIPAIILLFGIILTVSGAINAASTNTIITKTHEVVLTYNRLYVGFLMSIIGVATAVVGYRLFHGRLEFQTNSRELR